ncbi:MAG: hypothetical protein ACRC0L_02555 [Angustibacter sp.]
MTVLHPEFNEKLGRSSTLRLEPTADRGHERTVGSCAAHGWLITWIQDYPGSVRVSSGLRGLVVTVGDPGGADRRVGDRGPAGRYRPVDPLSTRILLSAEGRATVQAAAAPPALLVGGGPARTIPEVPGVQQRAELAAGERLLVLSADALDGLPVSRPRQHRPWVDQAGVADPASFLTDLFRDLDGGSGAMIAFGG